MREYATLIEASDAGSVATSRRGLVHRGRLTAFLLVAALGWSPGAPGGEPVKDGGWLRERDEASDVNVYTREMTLYPKAEPRPALKYRLLPDEFEMVDGNAAIYYLKAMGFLEQGPAHEKLREFVKSSMEEARRQGKPENEAAPYGWLNKSPRDLPLDKVKSYLAITSFQPRFLKDAAQRRRFDLDRNIRDVDDPLAYLLPDIQAMRELARTQSLRCKVAIAEGRIDEAFEILGQQYAQAYHLGQDEILVSNLVAIACAGIAWDDVLYLLEHPDTPNLYWAFASLPRPLVDLRRSMAFERQLLYLQFKVLREVSETPRPAGYWQDFLNRLIPQFGYLGAQEFGITLAEDPELSRAALVAYIAASYPAAKRYLIEDCGLARGQVDAYPTAQVVFLAIVRYYEQARDGYFKWMCLPYWQAASKTRGFEFDDFVGVKANRVGWAAAPAQLLLPAVLPARAAAARNAQQLAMVQAVEAIRMYGAAHGGKLPTTLDDLPVPVPLEPATGKPLDYRQHGEQAVLTGHDFPGVRYRLLLRFAKKGEK